MQGLGTLFLLLTSCVVSRADPVPALPDIQVQENFSESRVKLSSLAEMATVVACLYHWALLAKAYLSWGVCFPIVHISIPRGPF